MSFDLKVINGDLVLKNGDVDTVSGQSKLIQDIMKICLTTAGANIHQPWYGSFISRTLIGSALDTSITIDIAKNQLTNALDNLRKLQQLQLSNSLQQVSPDEHIAGITEIRVNRNQIDPRLFEVMVKVLTKSFRPTAVNFTLNNT
jgi:phage baseplate assembly protein W